MEQKTENSDSKPLEAVFRCNESALELAWAKYWAENGEQMIWSSWIEKYAAYINVEYLQDNCCNRAEVGNKTEENFPEQNTCFPSQAHKNCPLGRSNFEGIFNNSESKADGVNFSFDDVQAHATSDREAEENRKRILNPEFSPEIGDGWNPLSPFSVEESCNQLSNAEDERLLAR